MTYVQASLESRYENELANREYRRQVREEEKETRFHKERG